ncbi:BET2 Geranylgeranyl transferase type-2 subunit beta [Candida maltosa Xu316]
MAPPPFVKSKHVQYIINQEQNRTFEYWLSEHLRMNGLYWGVTALITMNELSALPSSEVIKYVLSCWDENSGAFGSFPKHDGHILSTLSALQILKIYSPELSMLTDLPDGSFQGDRYGEVDTRFVYTAVSALSLLGELSDEIGDRASRFIMRCFNFDGGFGLVPGSESHAAQVFTCVGTLAIVGKLGLLTDEKRIKMVDWLTERQVLPSGGFNGRAEKLPDVCYSWWVLSSLKMVDSADLIDKERLEEFILECQDLEHGGFGDRPDNATDVYHTCFSITALSLLDYEKYGFIEIDPIYCMPLKK